MLITAELSLQARMILTPTALDKDLSVYKGTHLGFWKGHMRYKPAADRVAANELVQG